MARLSRYVLPGYPQHVIQRGNNRQAIFADDEDRDYFLELLRGGVGKCGCDIHAYVLMTNHIHLLLTPHEGGGIVAPHPVYDALGPDAAARQAAYRQLFLRRIGAATLDETAVTLIA